MTPTALASPIATTTSSSSSLLTAVSPPTVAIVGCGPGGMFFCHALETRRQQLLQQSKDDPSAQLHLSNLPVVTCFERGASPGGVWRAKRQHTSNDENVDPIDIHTTTNNDNDNHHHHHKHHHNDDDDDDKHDVVDDITNMYEALWTNGPKEGIEFFDYTFDDHFQRPLPVYIPRQAVLDYMMARVTRHCPDFFEQYVQFHTSVESVIYNTQQQQQHGHFQITTRHVQTGIIQTQVFDKCIWAAGDNGKPKMPNDLIKMLQDGGFQGRILHSSDAHSLKENVQGKRVLMIGGGYSAEDLTLMAIKLGVAKVMISSRSDDPVVAWTGAWPMDKVKVYPQRVPVRVEDGGRSIQLAGVDYTWPNQYKTRRKAEKLRDIDTIIFCTGYEQSLEMMEDSLKMPFTSSYNDRFTAFPDKWKMKDNVLSDVTGHVKPGDVRYRLGCVMPGIYRGVLISNPSMMYLLSEFSEFPLLAADVNAWLLLGFITGTTPLPTSPEEMTRLNDQQALVELNMPWLRYWMDRNYRNKLDNVDDFWAEDDDDDDDDDDDPRWYQGQAQYDVYEMQRLAQFMKEANYPWTLAAEDGTLNEKGEALYTFNNASYYQRANLVKDQGEQDWKTFRDCENADEFYSIHTGTKAVQLKSPWLDLDDHDPNLV